ncbi:hypothetical protein Tcan_02417 [Toxocara canis]|uniref:Uncharacterized protein n=1 Tax=Toxocara canis TaxID=6265 RepID=A0A0B2UQL0_TOXCA|nr:hypothetical protein Tcan_02417 [Toxocara canis]
MSICGNALEDIRRSTHTSNCSTLISNAFTAPQLVLKDTATDAVGVARRLAMLWVVARCRCVLRSWKSESHLDCFQVDSWVAEEILNIASRQALFSPKHKNV